jgi:hypothetical protein
VDKRSSKRIRAQLSCWLKETDEAIGCCTYSISENGICVQCSDPLQPGKITRLQLFTHLSSEPLTLQAEVIWSTIEPDNKMGLRFIDLEDRTRNILRELMRKQCRVKR